MGRGTEATEGYGRDQNRYISAYIYDLQQTEMELERERKSKPRELQGRRSFETNVNANATAEANAKPQQYLRNWK